MPNLQSLIGQAFSLFWFRLMRRKFKPGRLNRLRKNQNAVILSEAKNLSWFVLLYLHRREILRSAQNDRNESFFRSLKNLSYLKTLQHSFAGEISVRQPNRAAREEAIDESHVVHNEKSEGEACESRGERKTSMDTGEAILRQLKRNRDGCGDQHHSGDRAKSKNQQIENGP